MHLIHGKARLTHAGQEDGPEVTHPTGQHKLPGLDQARYCCQLERLGRAERPMDLLRIVVAAVFSVSARNALDTRPRLRTFSPTFPTLLTTAGRECAFRCEGDTPVIAACTDGAGLLQSPTRHICVPFRRGSGGRIGAGLSHPPRKPQHRRLPL